MVTQESEREIGVRREEDNCDTSMRSNMARVKMPTQRHYSRSKLAAPAHRSTVTLHVLVDPSPIDLGRRLDATGRAGMSRHDARKWYRPQHLARGAVAQALTVRVGRARAYGVAV